MYLIFFIMQKCNEDINYFQHYCVFVLFVDYSNNQYIMNKYKTFYELDVKLSQSVLRTLKELSFIYATPIQVFIFRNTILIH